MRNPRRAIHSHRGMAMLELMTEIEIKLARRDHAFLAMPMCHANSLNFFDHFSLLLGRGHDLRAGEFRRGTVLVSLVAGHALVAGAHAFLDVAGVVPTASE